MRRARALRTAALLAVAGLGLSACAAEAPRFESIDDLVAAYLDAGGECDDFVVYDETGGDEAETAHCGIDTVLTVTHTEEQTSDVATGAMLRGATVLVGSRWVVQDPDAPKLADAMGGTLLALQEGPAPEAAESGAFVFGAGEPVIRVVVDPQCDFCQRFLDTNGDTLAELADADEATVEYRVLALHDKPENGFGSSYATNALACAADADPASFRPLLQTVLGGPSEAAWSQESLVSAASDAGADASECIDEGRYLFWGMDSTRTVLAEGLPGGEHVGGVPYISIDGVPFAESVDDAAAFAAAVDAAR